MKIRYTYRSFKHSKRATDLDHLVEILSIPMAFGALFSPLIITAEWPENAVQNIAWCAGSILFFVLKYTVIRKAINRMATEDYLAYASAADKAEAVWFANKIISPDIIGKERYLEELNRKLKEKQK